MVLHGDPNLRRLQERLLLWAHTEAHFIGIKVFLRPVAHDSRDVLHGRLLLDLLADDFEAGAPLIDRHDDTAVVIDDRAAADRRHLRSICVAEFVDLRPALALLDRGVLHGRSVGILH